MLRRARFQIRSAGKARAPQQYEGGVRLPAHDLAWLLGLLPCRVEVPVLRKASEPRVPATLRDGSLFGLALKGFGSVAINLAAIVWASRALGYDAFAQLWPWSEGFRHFYLDLLDVCSSEKHFLPTHFPPSQDVAGARQ